MKVFEEISIGPVKIGNRFVRSATWEGLASPDGAVTPRLLAFIDRLVQGGTGLLIASHAYVQKEGQAGPWQLGFYNDALMPGLRDMCDTVHKKNGVIFAQLAHAGANANAALSGLEPIAPTATENPRGEKSRTMTEEDIERLIGDFASAAGRAVEAGFDGLQIHAGHEYCLSQFLSPFYNKRTDGYGGSVEKRARLLVEIYRAVRKAVGDDYPVTAKVNAEDFIDGGLTREMMLETAAIMESEGFDAMEMSGGGGARARYRSSRTFDPSSPAEEAYYREAAALYKSRIKTMPLMLVGGIRSLETAERLVSEGTADMISLCRPLIREPGLIRRWASGDPGRAACISCDGCRKPAGAGNGLRCILEPEETRSIR